MRSPDMALNVVFSRRVESLRGEVRNIQALLEAIDILEQIPEPVRVLPLASRQHDRAAAVHVLNSTIGTLNLGEIQGSVSNKISALPPSADRFKVALDAVLRAVADDPSLGDDQRREAMEHLEFLAEAGRSELSERRSAVLRSALEGMGRLLSLATQAHDVWQQWQPVISGFLTGHR